MPPKKLHTFLATQLDLLKDKNYRFHEEEHIAVLSWLCRELGRRKTKGTPAYLDPKITGQVCEGGSLRLPMGERDGLKSVVTHALTLRYRQARAGQETTQKALRTILSRWGKKRKGWQTLNLDWLTENPIPRPSKERVLGLTQRTLTVQLNNSHEKADRILSVNFFLNTKGEVNATITYGYPRDASNWTASAGSAEHSTGKVADFLRELEQKPGETAYEAIGRITAHIETHTVEGATPSNWYPALGNTNARRIAEEKTYEELKARLHFPWGFTSGHRRADAGTRARFNGSQPYFCKEEAASMLAELLHDPHTTESEAEVLIKGLRRMRKIAPAAQSLAAFRATLCPRGSWGTRDRYENEPAPDYTLLRKGLAQAKTAGARVRIWVLKDPEGIKQNGLKQIPLDQINFLPKTHRIRYDGKTCDIGVIRQFDVA